MTSAEFLDDPDLVKSWRDTLATNETLKIVLGICDAEGPLHDEKPNTDPMIHYGEIRGYARYDDKLKALSILSESKPMPPRNYGVKPNK